MGTHTISNASTFHGWMESVGLDDFLQNPCSCIFGDEEEHPVPIPGQRARMSQRSNGRNSSTRSSSARARGGQMSRQATIEVDEPKSPFSSFSFFGGGR